MSTFNDKHVLITGGAASLGFLMGERALRLGARKLIIWDISPDNIAGAKQRLSQFSDEICTRQVDVSDPDQIYAAAEDILREFSHVDILINNAGIVTGKAFEQNSPQQINNTIGINLLGVMHTTRAFLPKMLNRNSGHIVNIASAAGLIANPKMSVYAGSKWGVIGWSESLRLEQEQQNSGVRVTTIEPSFINTGMFEGVTPPLLTPLLDAKKFSGRIIRAVQKNKIHLRAPLMVKLLPFLKGVLPTRAFDFVAGKLFRVYLSMDTFKGRTSQQ